MANVLATLFNDIATAIRSKTGSTDKMAPLDFPVYINNIVVGGGESATPEGWTTLIEEQTINPAYDSSLGCCAATVSLADVREHNLENGTIYIVHLDGVSYPIGMGGVLATLNKGQENEMDISIYCAGNYNIRQIVFGATPTYLGGDYKGNEPFYMMGKSGTSTQTQLYFPDTTPHTIKVDYMPRYGTT